MSSEEFLAVLIHAALPPAACRYYLALAAHRERQGKDLRPLAEEVRKLSLVQEDKDQDNNHSNYKPDQFVVSGGWCEGSRGIEKD